MPGTRTPTKTTLRDSEITTTGGFGRRALLLGSFGAATALAGCAAAPGITDADTGTHSDPPGAGRGPGATGLSDTDLGVQADQAGNGRGRRGCSDADGTTAADPIGHGRRC